MLVRVQEEGRSRFEIPEEEREYGTAEEANAKNGVQGGGDAETTENIEGQADPHVSNGLLVVVEHL